MLGCQLDDVEVLPHPRTQKLQVLKRRVLIMVLLRLVIPIVGCEECRVFFGYICRRQLSFHVSFRMVRTNRQEFAWHPATRLLNKIAAAGTNVVSRFVCHFNGRIRPGSPLPRPEAVLLFSYGSHRSQVVRAALIIVLAPHPLLLLLFLLLPSTVRL